MKVDFKSDDYLENIEDLNKMDDFYSGVKKIKNKGIVYLPQATTEDDDDYAIRLLNSAFENYTGPAVDNINSLLYRKNIGLTYKNRYKKMFLNLDGEGSTLTDLSISHSRDAIKDGLSFLWVDGQKIDEDMSKMDVYNNSLYPIIKNVKRKELLNFESKTVNGKKILKTVVLVQTVKKKINTFESRNVDQFIVLKVNAGFIFERDENNKEKFNKIDSWTNELGYIPFFTTYSRKTGFMKSDIPFLDVCELNRILYNIQSNDDNMRYLVSNPVREIAGYKPTIDKNTGKEIVTKLGTSKAIRIDDKTKHGFRYVTPDANAVNANENRIKVLTENIEKFSLSVLSKLNFKTATEANINDKNSSLFLVEVSNSLEKTLNDVFKCIEDYIGETIDVEIVINKDFDNTELTPEQINILIELRREGIISMDTIFNKLKKGEFLDISLDLEEEKRKIKAEIEDITLEEK